MTNNRKEFRICPLYDPENKNSTCLGQFKPGRSDSPYCKVCRRGEYYWRKRPPGDKSRYLDVLALRVARIHEWTSPAHTAHKHGNNVIQMRKRRHG